MIKKVEKVPGYPPPNPDPHKNVMGSSVTNKQTNQQTGVKTHWFSLMFFTLYVEMRFLWIGSRGFTLRSLVFCFCCEILVSHFLKGSTKHWSCRDAVYPQCLSSGREPDSGCVRGVLELNSMDKHPASLTLCLFELSGRHQLIPERRTIFNWTPRATVSSCDHKL